MGEDFLPIVAAASLLIGQMWTFSQELADRGPQGF